MKRLFGIALFVAAAFIGGALTPNVATYNPLAAIPAPAATATLAPPTTSPVPAVPGSTATDAGLPAGYPYTYYLAWDLNAVNYAVDVIGLNGGASSAQGACTLSVYGTFAANLYVTAATSLVAAQTIADIVANISAVGQYYIPLNGNTVFQVETLVYTSGDPIVVPNCNGGTVLLGTTLPK